jgi:glucokinase
MNSLLLAGDIGGTNTRLQLRQHAASGQELLYENTFRNQDHSSLAAIAEQFLAETAGKLSLAAPPHPEKACFAVAGPVNKKDNTCLLTNLHWEKLDGFQLAGQLQIEQVALINDFEAVGYGVLQLPDSEREILQAGASAAELPENAPIGVIGAGTGLGQAFLLKETQEERQIETVYPTEGGHVDFAARSQVEFDLLQDIKNRHNFPRISAERVVSGPGIVAIYQFLRDSGQYSELSAIAGQVRAWEASGSDASKAPTKGIADAALARQNELCVEALRMFAAAYGAEVGNFALKLLPYGGLYVAGGIAPKIFSGESWLRGVFLEALREKGRMQQLIAKIPLYLVTNEFVGLLGAARYAATKI